MSARGGGSHGDGSPEVAASCAGRGSSTSRFDIVIAGGGAIGLATACFAGLARQQGSRASRRRAEVGGTALKAAFWYWVPNNEPMKALGIVDAREDFLRYVARISRPEVYDPNHPRSGMSEWEYEACAAVYDNASTATELLHSERGAGIPALCGCAGLLGASCRRTRRRPTPVRTGVPGRRQARGAFDVGRRVHAVRTMSEAARKAGADIGPSHRVASG